MSDERILCAAYWLKDFEKWPHSPINIDCGIVVAGHRHPHIIGQVNVLTGKRQCEWGEYVAGFITNKNRFVDREEGAKIFVANGGELKHSKNKLYSEDLY